MDRLGRKEISDLLVPLASLVILDLLDLLVQKDLLVHEENRVSVGCKDLVEIPDYLDLLDNLDHQAHEDLQATLDHKDNKDLRAVVGSLVHRDYKVQLASRDLMDQQDGRGHRAARVQTVYRAILVVQALKGHTEILDFLVGPELSEQLDCQDL